MKGKIRFFDELSKKELRLGHFVLCSEGVIRCRHLPRFRKIAKDHPGVLFAMPSEELNEGGCGRAKAQVLASIKGVGGVVGCTAQSLKTIAAGKLGSVEQIGDVVFQKSECLINSKMAEPKLRVDLTRKPNDLKFMDGARQLVPKSDCWWRPTACLFVKKGKVILNSVSSNFWHSECQGLTVDPADIFLKLGERISFCNAIHAERSGIAQAARKGISLEKACLYVTTCPCEECAKVIAKSGLSRLVFESEYYDGTGLVLLRKNKIRIARIKPDDS